MQDCTCAPQAGIPPNTHTSTVASSINDDVLRVLIDMETCPAERRALVRILVQRQAHVA